MSSSRVVHDILVAVKSRVLTAALVAGLAATLLAGCRTNVGTAATVSGQKITESDVSDYITPRGPSSAAVANARANGQTVSPRSEVLQYLILEKVFEQTLQQKDNGGLPSPGQLAAVHDQAASVLLQTSLAGAELDKRINAGLLGAGVSTKLTKVFVRVQELEYTLIMRKQLTQLPELVALVKRAGVHVRVNPRYGKWNVDQLSLDGKVITPGYLSVQPSAPAA
jgi:hypothetical protein